MGQDDMRLQLNHLLFSGNYALSNNETAYIEKLAPLLRSAIDESRTDELVDVLSEIETQKETELRAHCDACKEPFLEIVDYLKDIESNSAEVGQNSSIVHDQITRTGNELVDAASRYNSLTLTSSNIKSSLDTLRVCLRALEYTNQIHTLLKQNERVAAVQSLSELREMGLHSMRHLGLGKMLSKAVPGLTNLILKSTKQQLDQVVAELQAKETEVGATAYQLLAKQRQEWLSMQSKYPHLQHFRFNSASERAYRKSHVDYFKKIQLDVDLSPLNEAHLVFSKVGRLDELRSHLHELRLNSLQKDPTDWIELQRVAGFCVIDRVLSQRLPELRPPALVNDIWQALGQQFMESLSKKIVKIADPEKLTPIRDSLTQFMETLENFDFNITPVSTLLIELLNNLSKHLVQQYRQSFLGTWKDAEHVSMIINHRELYEKIRAVVFDDHMDPEPRSFPKVLPFSEIYPLTCADLRALISYHTAFFDQFQRDPIIVESTLLHAVDEYLTDIVCSTIKSNLSINNRERLVQAVIDLSYLEDASIKIRSMLQKNRMSGRRGELSLRAIPEFKNAYKIAESKIFELFNSTIDNNLRMADYDWHRSEAFPEEQSMYTLNLAANLLTLVNSVLTRLPANLRSIVYLSTADHLDEKLKTVLLNTPDKITRASIESFDNDLKFLESTMEQLTDDPTTKSGISDFDSLAETRQMVNLMLSPDSTEYNNPQIRMKKYDRLRADLASQLIHKVLPKSPASTPKMQQGKFMRYISGDKT